MSKNLRKFETQAAYQAAQANLERPNVSLIEEGRVIEYNPYVAPVPITRNLDVTFIIDDTSDPTVLMSNYAGDYFLYECVDKMEVDGLELLEPVTSYVFDTTGEHTVRYILKEDVTEIPKSSFAYIFAYAPHDPRLLRVIIPNCITIIGYEAFSHCESLSSVTIPDSVTTIDSSAFQSCNLTNIIIPNSVTTIGEEAFRYNDLVSVTVMATTPPTLGGSYVLPDYYTLEAIYVPAASVDAYKAAEGWSNYASLIQAIP